MFQTLHTLFRRAFLAVCLVAPAAHAVALTDAYDVSKDAPVLIVFGQSNAEGWNTSLTDAEVTARTGLQNVKGISRSAHNKVGLTSIAWDAYSVTDHNLGDNYNGGKAVHLAGEFAKRWDDAIKAPLGSTAHKDLPTLYVIHMAWGGQGFHSADGAENRWMPSRDASSLESLYPRARQVLYLAFDSLIKQGKRPRVIGLHWNQWETENQGGWMSSANDVQTQFSSFLNGFREVLGNADFPIYLYRPRSTIYTRAYWNGDATKFNAIVQGLGNMANAGGNFRLIDAANATDANGNKVFNANSPNTYGIFNSDTVHYSATVQSWFAKAQWDLIFASGLYGGEVTKVTAPSASTATTSATSTVMSAMRSADFGGDGKPDLFFTNGSGNYVFWTMNIDTVTSAKGPFAVNTPWRVAGRADFTGDKKADLLWFNPSTDEYRLWTQNGMETVANTALPDHSAGWAVAAVADLSGDGKADLLWYNASTRKTVVWLMDGAKTWNTTSEFQEVSAGYSIVGTGDFDGDAKADVLLHNASTDDYQVWFMDGWRRASAKTLAAHATGWSVVGVADFTGDGKADMLWRNGNRYVMWVMNGATNASSYDVTSPVEGYLPHVLGDFDGDGKADILWKGPAGKLVLWRMGGTGSPQAGSAGLPTQPSSGWVLTH